MSGPYLSFPDADEVFWTDAPDGVTQPVYALNGPADAPAVLFGHANGFCAGSYAPFLKELGRHHRVFAFDARGHGASRWPNGSLAELFTLDRFADDLGRIAGAVRTRLGDAPLAYVGHSLSGAAALMLETKASPHWAGIMLFEPPVFPPKDATASKEASRLEGGTARRRAAWSSPNSFFDRLKGSATFQNFTDEMLRAHCSASLRPLADGGFTLACPPAVEAAIYGTNRIAALWAKCGEIAARVDLVSGDPTLPTPSWSSLTIGALAERLSHSSLTVMPKAGHLMFFEQPRECLALITKRLREIAERVIEAPRTLLT
jgi:pimeloyl-ACP methyl ester carboxylesterase